MDTGRKYKLAICSTNRWKYSETFIHAHYQLLGEGDLLLCDGYLPSVVSSDAGVSFSSIGAKKWFVGKKLNPAEALEVLLKKERITAVLAEFGPAGVEMQPICQKLNVNLVVHFHGFDAYRSDALTSYGKHYNALFNYAKTVIVVSEHMKAQLIDLGCKPEKIMTLRYGIDTQLFSPSREKSAGLKLISVGRFVPKKAPDLIIRAFASVVAKMPNAQLSMVGDGELMQECKRLAAELGVTESVQFVGVLAPKDVAKKLRESDVFIQHSATTTDNDSEGTPLSILEAMASGLAVVTTRHAGLPEIIDANKTGMLVNQRDWQAMAQEILRLLHNPKKRDELGVAARNYATHAHNAKTSLRQLQRILGD